MQPSTTVSIARGIILGTTHGIILTDVLTILGIPIILGEAVDFTPIMAGVETLGAVAASVAEVSMIARQLGVTETLMLL